MLKEQSYLNESVIRGHHLPPSLQKVSSEAEQKGIDLKAHLDSVEKELILDALKDARGNMAKAARLLGLTERVMGLRVNSHGINVKKIQISEHPVNLLQLALIISIYYRMSKQYKYIRRILFYEYMGDDYES